MHHYDGMYYLAPRGKYELILMRRDEIVDDDGNLLDYVYVKVAHTDGWYIIHDTVASDHDEDVIREVADEYSLEVATH